MTANETRAERFRRRVNEVYSDLSPADEEYVAEVVYTMDLLDRLRAEIASGDLTETRQGGPRMKVAVVEARLQAQHLASLLRRFPEISEDDAS